MWLHRRRCGLPERGSLPIGHNSGLIVVLLPRYVLFIDFHSCLAIGRSKFSIIAWINQDFVRCQRELWPRLLWCLRPVSEKFHSERFRSNHDGKRLFRCSTHRTDLQSPRRIPKNCWKRWFGPPVVLRECFAYRSVRKWSGQDGSFNSKNHDHRRLRTFELQEKEEIHCVLGAYFYCLLLQCSIGHATDCRV